MDLNECTRELWGRRYTFRPYLLEHTFGDGQQVVKLWPMHYRPYFYLARIDLWTDVDDGFDELDQIIDALTDELGHCCEDYDTCEYHGFEVWPALTPNSYDGWCWETVSQRELVELIP